MTTQAQMTKNLFINWKHIDNLVKYLRRGVAMESKCEACGVGLTTDDKAVKIAPGRYQHEDCNLDFLTAIAFESSPGRGIDLGDGNFSGCDQSGGDCPACGK